MSEIPERLRLARTPPPRTVPEGACICGQCIEVLAHCDNIPTDGVFCDDCIMDIHMDDRPDPHW